MPYPGQVLLWGARPPLNENVFYPFGIPSRVTLTLAASGIMPMHAERDTSPGGLLRRCAPQLFFKSAFAPTLNSSRMRDSALIARGLLCREGWTRTTLVDFSTPYEGWFFAVIVS